MDKAPPPTAGPRVSQRTAPPIELIPYADDPLSVAAERLIAAARPTRPLDLRRAVVLFPHSGAIPRFRQVLLARAESRGHEALLAPHCGTLRSWAATFAEPDRRQLSEVGRELLLLEALAEHPSLVDRFGTWPLVDSLFDLFDELGANGVGLGDQQTFARALAAGYGIDGLPPAPLSDEAQLAHTLWNGWRRQLQDEGARDALGAYLSGLGQSLQELNSEAHLYLVGFVLLTRAEIEWVRELVARGQLTLLLHGRAGEHGYHPEAVFSRVLHELDVRLEMPPAGTPYSQFVDTAYALTEGDLSERARHLADRHPESPAGGRLAIHEATDFEQEARAIDVQARYWLLQGHRRIGIVTNDRKLARRVRALLERAQIVLRDEAGWALSTTSAATALMRLIDCVEQDFAFGPLLDLLRSPFVSLHLSSAELHERTMWLEQSLRQLDVTSGLRVYQRALTRQHAALSSRYDARAPAALKELFARLNEATMPLTRLIDARGRPAQEYLCALNAALDALGMRAAYETDEAGASILALLEEMLTAFAARPLSTSWGQVRQWLRRNLERRRFQPPTRGGVQLMGFSESRLCRFDALIIAGALREHLPGYVRASPLFNDGVRQQLGLPPRTLERTALFNDLRRLLEAAPRVLITLRAEQAGENIAPSPWIERLRALHKIAYGSALDDPLLARLARSPTTDVVCADSQPLPRPRPYPVATLPPGLVPHTVSASAHQSLLDCPYQYYARYGLRLSLVEEFREQLEKREYGERVHRILQAFHIGVAGLPGPFSERLAPQTLSAAQAMLAAITEAVFAPDIARSPLARGWSMRWQAMIAPYLHWQLKREERFTPAAGELPRERALTEGEVTVSLSARIDRIDHSAHGCGIIDYKTGRVPKLHEVVAGEQVQLPFYGLVVPQPAIEARYLELDGPRVRDGIALEGEALQTLSEQVRIRLLATQRALRMGTGLPAWGDDTTCARCSMQGLCRREMWHQGEAE